MAKITPGTEIRIIKRHETDSDGRELVWVRVGQDTMYEGLLSEIDGQEHVYLPRFDKTIIVQACEDAGP